MTVSTPASPRWRRLLAWRGHRWLALVVRVYLGGVFIFAAWHKILHPDAFAADVATYQLLPLAAVNAFALGLPWLELVAGAMLVLGVRVQAAAALVAAMMVAFMVALGWALYRDLDVPCGCFGSEAPAKDDPISWLTLARDAAWLAMAAYVLVFDRVPLGVARLRARLR